jgi:GNAT superfamily N-acetyltransferase
VNCALRSVESADWPRLGQLVAESLEDGYDFLDTLVDELRSGANRFDRPGEMLLGAFDGAALVAVGGVTHDPYTEEPGIGRIRRVYVLRAFRGFGVGSLLVRALMVRASAHFHIVTLRTDSERAARFYTKLGFSSSSGRDAVTHIWLPPATPLPHRGGLLR